MGENEEGEDVVDGRKGILCRDGRICVCDRCVRLMVTFGRIYVGA